MTPAEFEAEVRTLLSLQGWTCTPERLLGYKKVDAYAERADGLGGAQRLAIECKAWNTPLSQNDLTQIYANYQPLIESNLIDAVLIVTLSGVAASAEAMIAHTRGLRTITHQQLSNTLIDFRGYLAGLISSFANDEVSSYYVPQSFSGGSESLEEHIRTWIHTDESTPIAVLGGYGSGKSTLSRRLASLLAAEALRDPSARVPVLLPLGHVATDQTLDGLLGRLFTSVTVCSNYSYPLFLALNSRGRFVFFLDGFDEMKKTMSWDSLVYNLGQLNQLVVESAKVVLLGRPSAFLSSDEQNEALHGKTKVLGRDRRLPNWPDYHEIELLPFSQPQIALFIQRYLKLLPAEPRHKNHRRRLLRYLGNIERDEGKRLVDLAARPVQLRMLMDLLPYYQEPIDKLTVAILYSEFIDLLLRREADKVSRGAFTKEQRRRFAAALAYWMWCDKQRGDVDARLIPDSLIAPWVALHPDIHPQDVKRDLLSGGFVDRKPPNTIHFPHRSFQEFLVADELVHLARTADASIADIPYLTPEVTSFFLELIGKDQFAAFRERWQAATGISDNLRELLDNGCAHFELRFVSHLSDALRKASYARHRDALMRRLQVGILENPSAPKKERLKKPDKTAVVRSRPVRPRAMTRGFRRR